MKSFKWALALLTCLALLFGLIGATAEETVFPFGTLLRVFDTQEDISAAFGEQSNNFTLSSAEGTTGFGALSAEIGSAEKLGWGNQMFINLGNGLGATDAANAKFIGLHVRAAKGAPNGTRRPDAFLMQDVQICSGGAWYTVGAGETYYLLPDGASEWTTDTTDGSSTMLDSEFAGYLVYPLSAFTSGGEALKAADVFSKEWGTYLCFHVNGVGGELGSMFLDTFFYNTQKTFPVEEVIAQPAMPLAVMLRDFETQDDVTNAFSDQNNGFTVSLTDLHTGNGAGAVMLSSETDLHWGNQMFINLGNGLGNTDAAFATHIGFHIQAAKGAPNGTRRPDAFLMQDIQICSAGAWYTFAAGSPYLLLPDGAAEWTNDTTDGSSLMLDSEYSGYVFLPVSAFDAGGDKLKPADVFSKEWGTYLAFHINAAGGDYGAFYLDSFMAATSPKLGGILRDFETQDDVTAAFADQNNGFTVSLTDLHTGNGAGAAMLSSETDLHWGNQIYINLGNGLGATGAADAEFIGLHIQASKAAANGTRRPDAFLMQDIQLTSAGAWYTFAPGSTYYMLKDGETVWTTDTTDGSSLMLDSEYSGYVYLPVSAFDAGGDRLKPADAFSKEWGTYLAFHINAAGGDFGSMYLDTISYLVGFEVPADDEPEEILYEDIDAISYAVDETALAAVNGVSALPASQEVYILADFEEGVIEDFYPYTTADRFAKSFSALHTGDGARAVKLSCKRALSWNGSVPYLRIGVNMGAEDHPASQMAWIGLHIKTPNVADFRIQDVQLASEGRWYTLKGGSAFYTMTDGAAQWEASATKGTSTMLPGNWSGFVVFNINDFLSDSKSLIPAEVFAKENETMMQVHFNVGGGEHGSVFVDTYFGMNAAFNPDAPTLTVDGAYKAGLTAAPAQNVLTSLASSEKIVKIAGSRIYARENTVAGFQALLSAEGCDIAITKGDAIAEPDEALAQGMIVTVVKGSEAIAAYAVADVTKTPDPAVCFALSLTGNATDAGLTLEGNDLSCFNWKAEELIRAFNVPTGAAAALFEGDTRLPDDAKAAKGMTVRCFDEKEPAIYNEITLTNVIVPDLTNGYVLTLADGATATVEGGVIRVPEGTTASQLVAMFTYVNADEFGLVLDADEFALDETQAVAPGMVMLVVNDMYEELARWTIE